MKEYIALFRNEESALGWWSGLSLTLLLCATLLGLVLQSFWIPHDEGTLNLMASRILAGDTPHLDFDDPYTGLISYLHAGAHALWGSRILAPRLLLLFTCLPVYGVLYALFTQWYRPGVALGLVLLCLVWGPAYHFSATPSWYVLFTGILICWSMHSFLSQGLTRYLWLAGFLAGLACLCKITGLYHLAALLLFLVFHSQESTLPGNQTKCFFVCAGLLLFSLCVSLLLRNATHGLQTLFLGGPLILSACALGLREYLIQRGSLKHLFGKIALVLLGFFFALLPFCIWFGALGGLEALYQGLFQTPFQRIDHASRPFAVSGACVVLSLAIAALSRLACGKQSVTTSAFWVLHVVLICLAIIACLDSGWRFEMSRTLRLLVPALLLPLYGLLRAPSSPENTHIHFLVFLIFLTCTTALVQFPYSYFPYFLYMAPILILALAAWSAQRSHRVQRCLCCLGIFAFWLPLAAPPGKGIELIDSISRRWIENDTSLALAKGNIKVIQEDALAYQHILQRLRDIAPRGPLYAFPDAPEYYFLAGLPSPTRWTFDFFHNAEYTATAPANLEAQGIRFLILNHSPGFSKPVPVALLQALRETFPHGERVQSGRIDVELRWRTPPRPGE